MPEQPAGRRSTALDICSGEGCTSLDTLRAENARLRRCLADTCHVLLTDPAVTDTLWKVGSEFLTVADDIAQVLGIDTCAPTGGPSDALAAMRAKGGAK